MFQIIYETNPPVLKDGVLQVKTPSIDAEITVTPDSARKRANGYLARYVALAVEAHSPALIWTEHPIWRMQVYLSLPEFGRVALLGEIDIDAETKEPVPLTDEQIKTMQTRADIIASRLSPRTN